MTKEHPWNMSAEQLGIDKENRHVFADKLNFEDLDKLSIFAIKGPGLYGRHFERLKSQDRVIPAFLVIEQPVENTEGLVDWFIWFDTSKISGRTKQVDVLGLDGGTRNFLARNKLTLDTLRDLAPDRLRGVPGIGDARARKIIQGLSDLDYRTERLYVSLAKGYPEEYLEL